MGKKDITLKNYLSDTRRYADLLNGSIFQGKQIIHAEELQETATVQSKSDHLAILERTNDIAMKQTQDGSLFAVWLVEFQKYLCNQEACNQMDMETYQTLGILTGIKELTNKTILKEEADTNMWKAIEDLIADGKTEGRSTKSFHDRRRFFLRNEKSRILEVQIHGKI